MPFGFGLSFSCESSDVRFARAPFPPLAVSSRAVLSFLPPVSVAGLQLRHCADFALQLSSTKSPLRLSAVFRLTLPERCSRSRVTLAARSLQCSFLTLVRSLALTDRSICSFFFVSWTAAFHSQNTGTFGLSLSVCRRSSATGPVPDQRD